MILGKNIFIVLVFFLSTLSFAQQVDFKSFIQADSNIINKNTIFNWYWSSYINKKLQLRHIREFKVTYSGNQVDTTKINTLAFDQDGKLKRWNSVAFRYSFDGKYIGYVDTIQNAVVLPNKINTSAFTDFTFYAEKRDDLTNLLHDIVILEHPKSDSCVIKYSYNPILYLKGEQKEINGESVFIPDGPKCYINSIKVFKRKNLIYEHFLVYELYEE